MSKEIQAVKNDLGQLAEDAHALMTATADVAGEKVGEARKRLAAALERAKEIAGTAVTRRSPVRKPPTQPCMSIRIRPSPSGSGSGRFSAFCSPVVVPATATDFLMAASTAESW
jgi:hypothetical protein